MTPEVTARCSHPRGLPGQKSLSPPGTGVSATVPSPAAHAHAEEHPVMSSLEPGEDWGWCYLDERTLPALTS